MMANISMATVADRSPKRRRCRLNLSISVARSAARHDYRLSPVASAGPDRPQQHAARHARSGQRRHRPGDGQWRRLQQEIPIEQRSADATMTTVDGRIETVRIVPGGSPVANYGFDVTPSRLVSGLITERGVLQADRDALASAFPERAANR
jgi:hypothetical protein